LQGRWTLHPYFLQTLNFLSAPISLFLSAGDENVFVVARLASPSAFISKNSLIYGGSAKMSKIKTQEILCALCAFAVQGTLVP